MFGPGWNLGHIRRGMSWHLGGFGSSRGLICISLAIEMEMGIGARSIKTVIVLIRRDV